MSEPEFLLIDHEEFSARDREAAKLTYGRVHPERPPLLALSQSEVKQICCLNLTPEHFQHEGATKLSDLKPDAFNLLCSLLNAMGHAGDRKKNPRQPVNAQPTAQPAAASTGKPKKSKKTKGKRRKRTREEELAQDDDAEESTDDMDQQPSAGEDAGAPDERMQGDEHASLYVETLFSEQFQVVGFRLWFFDASVHKTRVDLLTRAMRESLTEAGLLQRQIQTKMEQFQRSLGTGSTTGKRQQAQKTCEVTPRYRFAQYDTEELYLTLVRQYFLGDTLMTAQARQQLPQSTLDRLMDAEDEDGEMRVEDDEELARQAKPRFTDPRPFMALGQQQQQSLRQSQQRAKFELPALLCKEQAMVYHVETAGVRVEQRSLHSYFAPFSERVKHELERQRALEQEGRQRITRLEELLKHRLEEKQFHHFPYPHTTYRVESSCLSLEVMSEMVWPHRLGSYLYTQGERQQTLQRIQQQRGQPVDDSAIETLNERLLARPLGLHDMELEVTPGLLHQHQELLGDEMRRHLTARSVPQQLAHGFLAGIRNTVQRELQTMNGLLRQTKTDLVEQRQGGQPVINNRAQQHQLYRASTPARLVDTRHRQHLLDRRMGREVGLDQETRDRERATMLAEANLNYHRPRLGKWRPTHATLANVKKKCTTLRHDEVFMARDIHLVLHCLNEYGYAAIRAKYTDPKTGQIREGQWEAYQRERREFMESITVEFWDEFFRSPHVSFAGEGIRKDLLQSGQPGVVGRRMPLYKCDLQATPYQQYKLQLYAYFADHCGLNHHYKTMYNLWHAASHHCRFFQPGCTDPKMAMIMGGDGDVGKSWRLEKVKESCPSGVCEGITYMSAKAMLTDMNWNDTLIINHEMSNKLVGPADLKGDAAMDDERNQRKEMMTAQQTTTLAFYFDDETGDRKAKLSKCQCQCNILGATNVKLGAMDQHVASRFIIFTVPSSVDESEGNRAQDKEKSSSGCDEAATRNLVEQQRMVRRVYCMMEHLIKAGVLEDVVYGANVDGARILINKVLNQMQNEYRVPTNKPRKRKHVLEMARVLCIQSWCWYVLTSPLERHLQHHPVTGAFIGLNPRVLLAIADRLVVTSEHVVDALTMLGALWSHDYQDVILDNFATTQCRLDQLRKQDFLHRPPGNSMLRGALDGAPLTFSTRPQRKATAPTWSLAQYVPVSMGNENGEGSRPQQPDEEWDVDYNYIVLSGKSYDEIYKKLQDTTGALRVSTPEIDRLLRTLSGNKIECDAYEMGKHPVTGKPRLVRSKDATRRLKRKAVDMGKDPATDLYAIALSVAFLKEKLPHKLHDAIVQNLAVPDSEDSVMRASAQSQPAEGTMDLEDPAQQARQPLADDTRDLQQRLASAMCIEPGASNETAVLRAIRDVLECDVLGLTGESTPEEEAEVAAQYGDVITGESPCSHFLTSEHPASLPTASVFEDFDPARPGEVAREISMVDLPASIRLQRNPRRPLVHYNHMTVSPLARVSLSIYQQKHGMDAGGVEEGEEEEEEETVQRRSFLLHAQQSTFRYRRDIDFAHCEAHLRNMACPVPRVHGRLINYPPHVYMELIDWRDEQERRSGQSREFVQPYSAVVHRVQKMREMWDARRGLLHNAMDMDEFLASDCSANDLRAYNASFAEPVLRRRQPAQSTRQSRETALKSLYAQLDRISPAKASPPRQQALDGVPRTPKTVQRRKK